MKRFTFWLLLVLELAYCSGTLGSIFSLEIDAYEGSHILEWSIAIAFCGICALLTWIYCRKKQIDASEVKAYMQTGIVVSFGIVSALAVVVYITQEPWGGYFL